MIVEQIYTNCLAQGTYYIHCGGEAAIIDPLREITPYIQRAKRDKVNIKYIFETHFHADFISGHVTLSEKTNAPIIYGPNANPAFQAHIAKDEELFQLGKSTIKVLHTPGHTMESSCYLLIDENGKEQAIFTGDTLFLGDVGRPDLAQKEAHISQKELATILFDSLRNKIMPLPNHITVYPAHGAGSACGKNMMKETVDTLGNQKKVNYALRANMTKKEFVNEVTYGLLPPPKYFPSNVKMNKEGYKDIDEILKIGLKTLDLQKFELFYTQKNALILDVRKPQEFAEGHIPNSIFIGLDGSFAPWVGEIIIDIKQPILLVSPEGREAETIIRLSRVGFDNTLGYLKGGFETWKKSGKKINNVKSIPASQLALMYKEVKNNIVDVRKTPEYNAKHVVGANNIALNQLYDSLDEFSQNKKYYIYCAAGYRSMIACSILKSKGFYNLIDIKGGFEAIEKVDIPLH